MAVPPNLYSRVSFNPPLPRRQHQMHQHQSLGLVIKVHAVYSTPFWREDGLSGTGFGAGSLVQEVYDNTNHGDSRGTLVGFVSDEKADAVFELSAEDRSRAILESIAGFLGDKALEPEVYYESDWGSEEWTRGAYASSYDLGGLHRYGKDQHAPVGPSTGAPPTSPPRATSTWTAPSAWASALRRASPRAAARALPAWQSRGRGRRRLTRTGPNPFNVE